MRKTTTQGRSENLGGGSCEQCDVKMFGDAYKYSDTTSENDSFIFSRSHNASVIHYHVEYANTSCI
jgi:hypothetical protein